MVQVIYLHGFASSGHSDKALLLAERFRSIPNTAFHCMEFSPTKKDFEFMTLTGRINRLRQYILMNGWNEVRLLGSSLGALVALHYAARFGGVERIFLLGPALRYHPWNLSDTALAEWERKGSIMVPHPSFQGEVPLRVDLHHDGAQYAEPIAPAVPVVIIHGRFDDTVPMAESRVYAETHPDLVRLVEVDSGHRLLDQMDVIMGEVRSFLLA